MTQPPERLWDDLLLFIEEGKVVPVIGAELLTVGSAEAPEPLYRWLASALATSIGLPAEDLPADVSLDDVVSLHLRRGGDRDALYPRMLQVLRTAPPTQSPALQALASIPALKLFVSLTFDSQLAQALTRDGTAPRQLAYAPNAARDLPVPNDDLREPLVYHLLGRAASTPDYVLSDEDLLEFVHALQDGQRRPGKLFDALRANHLLILGCGFGDWLARFFLRTARGLELSQKRRRLEVVADTRSNSDAALTVFLASYSAETHVLAMPAQDFALELARRWHASHPQATTPVQSAAAAAPRAESGPRDGAIFISYARENVDIARRLAAGLRAERLDVWFDERELQPGDEWDRAIQRGIERCALFLPLVSRETLSENNRRRYFWREWNAADHSAQGMAGDEEFILPVSVDGSPLHSDTLPASFRRKQGVMLPGGEVSPELAQRLTAIVRQFHRRRRDAA